MPPFNTQTGGETQQPFGPPTRAQLQYPLDLQSEGALKYALENVLKDVIVRANRTQTTLLSGATFFEVASSYMVLTAQAAVTIATIRGGREGMILTLQFTDGNITITDTGTGAADTVNLRSAFTSVANDVIQLQYDGTSWREVSRGTAITTPVSLANGGTGASLSDPNANRYLGWDDTDGSVKFLIYGNGLTYTAGTDTLDVDSASTTVDGIVELATAAETTTGTDATRAVTPDGLAGSDYGKRIVELVVVEGATNVAVGDKQGNLSFRVPAEMNGWNLVGVAAHVETAGTTNNLDIQINNITQAADMLTTKMRIETGETDTSTSAQPGTIDTANDDVATGDKIRVDVDAVQTTAPKGLTCTLVFQLP